MNKATRILIIFLLLALPLSCSSQKYEAYLDLGFQKFRVGEFSSYDSAMVAIKFEASARGKKLRDYDYIICEAPAEGSCVDTILAKRKKGDQ